MIDRLSTGALSRLILSDDSLRQAVNEFRVGKVILYIRLGTFYPYLQCMVRYIATGNVMYKLSHVI